MAAWVADVEMVPVYHRPVEETEWFRNQRIRDLATGVGQADRMHLAIERVR